jgi:hypothetical protein
VLFVAWPQVPLLLDAAQRKQLDTLKSTLNEVRRCDDVSA